MSMKYLKILLLLILFNPQSEAVPGSIIFAADREVKEAVLREHTLYQEGIRLALQAAHLRNVYERTSYNMLTSDDYKPLTPGILVSSKRFQTNADNLKDEILIPLRKIFEAPSTPRFTEKAKAFFSGMGESVKDTLELPLVLGKFGITAAQSVIEWEDKLGLKSVQEAIEALLTQAKHNWENPAAYEERSKAAKAYTAKVKAYEKA
jgi:hypothetical protein